MKLATSPGVSVTLRVGGVALEEYDDPEESFGDHPIKRVKYVEAVPGAKFDIHFQSIRDQLGGMDPDEVNLRIYMDGKKAASRVLRARSAPAYHTHVDCIRREMKGEFFQEKFAFAELSTSLNPADFKSLGEIQVTCTFVRRTGPSRAGYRGDKAVFAASNGNESLPEKVLKGRAISSKVSLSAIEPLGYAPMAAQTMRPYGDEPFATYIFRYRSRGDLQIENVIPRPPSPVPLELRDPNSLTLAEGRELLLRNREKEAEQARIKNEHVNIKKEKRDLAAFETDDNDDELTITGASQPSKRARMSTDSAVEIVDLTDD